MILRRGRSLDDETSIGEPRVMLEYVAEAHAFAGAYPTSRLQRDAIRARGCAPRAALTGMTAPNDRRVVPCLERLENEHVSRLTAPAPVRPRFASRGANTTLTEGPH